MKRNIKQRLVCGRTRILWRKHRHKAIQAMCQLWKQLFHCVIDAVFWGRNDQTSVTVCHEHTTSETDKHTGVFPQCHNLLTNNKFTSFSFGEGVGQEQLIFSWFSWVRQTTSFFIWILASNTNFQITHYISHSNYVFMCVLRSLGMYKRWKKPQ